jgi:ABC-type multidrug transport system ATPase subunit
MNDCQIGECVAQAVIDAANNNGSSSSSSRSGSAPLSGGVIAGLAVVGALILGFILLFIWGWFVQRKARKLGGDTAIRSGGVSVVWRSINYSVPVSSSGGMFKKKTAGEAVEPAEKHILTDLSGKVTPGEMLAILGPSGAGKTTLIEILGGKSKIGKTTGSVAFTAATNPAEETAIVKQPRIGYVDQQDILPSMLTVQEALLFAAQLRLPESVTQAQKLAKVFEVMKQLGILDIKDTRIGNHERRGISGGEQRRVSIGLELVACPDVLVLDEPTSGLDSVSAHKVVSVLRELAHDPANPTAIIATIHQPNSRLYQLFDNILVLSHGRELYFGPGGLAPNDYFAAKGYPAQPGYNVADHLLDIASEPTDELLAHARKKSGSKTSATATTADDGNTPREEPRPIPYNGQPQAEHDPDTEKNGSISTKTETPKHAKLGAFSLKSNYAVTFLTQLEVLCGREWKILKR